MLINSLTFEFSHSGLFFYALVPYTWTDFLKFMEGWPWAPGLREPDPMGLTTWSRSQSQRLEKHIRHLWTCAPNPYRTEKELQLDQAPLSPPHHPHANTCALWLKKTQHTYTYIFKVVRGKLELKYDLNLVSNKTIEIQAVFIQYTFSMNLLQTMHIVSHHSVLSFLTEVSFMRKK